MTEPAFVERSRYYLAYEYPTKIRLALETLDETTIWKRQNQDSNSIGNLMLHLAGNVREWIVGGIGGQPVDRDRSAEFAASSGFTKSELLSGLTSSVIGADKVLSGVSESDLDRHVTIQGRDTTVLAAVYHVVEHFRCIPARSSCSPRCTRRAPSGFMRMLAEWRYRCGAARKE